MRTFGICMEGCEDSLERLMVQSVARAQDEGSKRFQYVEVGVMHGSTLKAFSSILSENVRAPMVWSATGIDIVLHEPSVLALLAPLPAKICDDPFDNGINLFVGPAVPFLTNVWKRPIDFALIDGCHGKPCVMADFNAVAKHCCAGSVVVFHDVGALENEPGGPRASWQPHCEQFIGVAAAIDELGLHSEASGWRQIAWIDGDTARNGNSAAAFEKV